MSLFSTFTYQASAFHESFPNGRMSGSLESCGTEVAFIWPQGRYALPHRGIVMRAGGNNNRLIFFEHPQHPGWSIYTTDHTVLKDKNLLADPHIAQSIKTISHKKTLAGTILVAVFGLFAAAILGLILARPWIVDRLAAQVPPSWEVKLGETVMAQYSYQKEFFKDEQLEATLKQLTHALTDHIEDKRYDFNFQVIRDPSLNAFALPGGQVVIHSEAILAVEDADELAGVLAHEIAHVTRRHGIRNLINSMGLVLLAQTLIGDASALAAFLSEAAPYLLQQDYSRESEREADSVGLDYLTAAQIDPQGLADFFKRLEKEYGDQANNAMAFLSTHPTTQERIETIEAQIAARPPSEYRNLNPILHQLQDRLKTLMDQPSSEGEPHEESD